MKISTKGDYATRALQDLAFRYNEGPVQITEIARRQKLPVRYLEQLLLGLKRAGLLASKRGVNGGYYLAKHPREITLGQVLRTMDGPIAPIFCLFEGERAICSQEPICVLRDIWREVHEAIAKIVDRTTLEDLCERVRMRAGQGKVNYQI